MTIEQIKQILEQEIEGIEIEEFHGVNSPTGDILVWIYFNVGDYDNRIEVNLMDSESDLLIQISDIKREMKEEEDY